MTMNNNESSHFPILSFLYLSIRIGLANKAPITDCDEVYNYWEPIHFMNYASGMQTWEYAPQYALRTYAYLQPISILSHCFHIILSQTSIHMPKLYHAFSKFLLLSNTIQVQQLPSSLLLDNNIRDNQDNHATFDYEHKILVFILLRISLSFFTAWSELRLCKSLFLSSSSRLSIHSSSPTTTTSQNKNNIATTTTPNNNTFISNSHYNMKQSFIGLCTMFLLITSTGMYHSSPALLPSCTVMNYFMNSLACQLQVFSHPNQNTNYGWDEAIVWGLLAVFTTGWPFCAILFLPLGVYSLAHVGTNQPTNILHQKQVGQESRYNNHRFYIMAIRRMSFLLLRVILYSIIIQTYVFMIDYIYYGRIISPTWRIFTYNTGLFSNEEDTTNRDILYGVEGIDYYIKNLLLNWNIISVTGLLSLPYLLLRWCTSSYWCTHNKKMNEQQQQQQPQQIRNQMKSFHVMILLPMYLWFGVVASRPHKEERFLFPIYPLFALGTAIMLDDNLDSILFMVYKRRKYENNDDKYKKGRMSHSDDSRLKFFIGLFLLSPSAIISISRSISLSDGYTAPIKLYTYLHLYEISKQHQQNELRNISSSFTLQRTKNNIHSSKLVCVAGEWYRYPSSYFLPKKLRLAFLKSSFSGQLPQQFTEFGSKEHSLSVQKGKFNDVNEEEKDRYVDISSCSYVIELVNRKNDNNIPSNIMEEGVQYMMSDETGEWEKLVHFQFLDAMNTSMLHRTLYIPYFTKRVYNDYTLFARKE